MHEPVRSAFDRDAVGDAHHGDAREREQDAEEHGRGVYVGDPTLKAQVREQMTAALRVGDKLRLGALRMLAASIMNREKEVLHQLADAEVDALIDGAISAAGATSMQDMGRVMGAVIASAKGRVDGSVVQRKVRERLAG